jgi:RNA polymerase sigma factor (sigma-70 family)
MNALLNSSLLPQDPDRPLIRNARKHGDSASERSSTTTNSGRGPSSRIGRKDWNLVRQAVRGDSRAQQELFATHAARLYRTAYAVVRNKEDAEDAVQNSLCNAFINLRSFKGRSSFSTWLTRIVINSALMIRRRRTAHVQTSLDEMMDDQPRIGHWECCIESSDLSGPTHAGAYSASDNAPRPDPKTRSIRQLAAIVSSPKHSDT